MQVVLGVVCSIATCDVFSATLEGGATLNGKPISVSQNGFERSILCTALSLYKKEYAKACADVIFEAYMQCNDVRRFGSCALELCYIAAGRCELYFEMRLFPWDYAAASLILTEAGGVIRSLNDEEAPLDRPTLLVAANNQENYKKLSSIVNKHIKVLPY
jgi:myo-inositol-1(or 4)-monophosphatase